MDLFYWTAFTIGFFGSFHCAGMCGPIAMALPGRDEEISKLIVGRIVYNAGRVITYSTLGIFSGILGKSFSIRGWQSDISIATGILILIGILLTNQWLIKKLNWKLTSINFGIKKALGSLLRKHGYLSMLGVGMVNGILPCGFVYIALAGSVSAGSVPGSVIYMALFGAGTVPMMLGLSLSGLFISAKSRNIINRFTPVIAFVLALFLINRGISMKSENHSCCKPAPSISMNIQMR